MGEREKPWVGTLDVSDDKYTPGWISSSECGSVASPTNDNEIYWQSQTAKTLIQAAPALARALAMVEWEGAVRDGIDVCPQCGNVPPYHQRDCALDVALMACGMTAEDRVEVRRGR